MRNKEFAPNPIVCVKTNSDRKEIALIYNTFAGEKYPTFLITPNGLVRISDGILPFEQRGQSQIIGEMKVSRVTTAIDGMELDLTCYENRMALERGWLLQEDLD